MTWLSTGTRIALAGSGIGLFTAGSRECWGASPAPTRGHRQWWRCPRFLCSRVALSDPRWQPAIRTAISTGPQRAGRPRGGCVVWRWSHSASHRGSPSIRAARTLAISPSPIVSSSRSRRAASRPVQGRLDSGEPRRLRAPGADGDRRQLKHSRPSAGRSAARRLRRLAMVALSEPSRQPFDPRCENLGDFPVTHRYVIPQPASCQPARPGPAG